MNGLAALSIAELRDGYASREYSPTEVLEDALAQIERTEPTTHALVAIRSEEALAEARSLGGGADPARPLAGIPFVAKDLLDVEGLPTRCGSRARDDATPATRDADPVARLRHAGAILIGKSRTHEFGWGITTVAADGTATANPRDPERIAGGSSGGSAGALASGQVPLALGTDTAGSVRIPADFCGVVGHRPTSGLVSGRGVFPLAPSLDEVGPMTRSPADAEIVLDILAPRGRGEPPANLAVGVSAELLPADADPDRLAILERVASGISEAFGPVREVELAGIDGAYEVMGTIILAEGLAGHRREGLWPERGAAYGADVRDRLERAEAVGLADYTEAGRRRRGIRDVLSLAFGEVDVLLSLNSGVGPIRIAEPGTDPSFRRAVMTCTAIPSLAGLPACSVPAGVDARGLPVGVQVSGRPGSDREVLRVARFVHEAFAPDRREADGAVAG